MKTLVFLDENNQVNQIVSNDNITIELVSPGAAKVCFYNSDNERKEYWYIPAHRVLIFKREW